MAAKEPRPKWKPLPSAKWRKLFIFKRYPRLFGVSKKINRPSQGALPGEQQLYNTQLEESGFISETVLANKKLASTAELQTDLNILEENLLPRFWGQDNEALQNQNKYYLYQWVFILGALLTTMSAAIGVYVFESNPEGKFLGLKLTEILQITTAILSGISAIVSYLSAKQSPQERWFKARINAESLRTLYFLFLARREPFNSKDATKRAQALRLKVLEVLKPGRK